MSVSKPKIPLLIGGDIIAHREMVPTVEHMVRVGFEPVLFYSKHKAPSDPEAYARAMQPALQDYVFVERHILQETIYPFLEANPSIEAQFPTPLQVSRQFNLRAPAAVENINDPAFYKPLADEFNSQMLLSLRNTQMVGEAMADYLKSNGCMLLNVHSGLLPAYRGLYSTPRAMAEAIRQPESGIKFGPTLHHMDAYGGQYKGIDTGNIVDYAQRVVDTKRTVYATNIVLSGMASDMIKENLNSAIKGNSLDGHPQSTDPRPGRYFSYPATAELVSWKAAGLKMFDYEETIQVLHETFNVPGSPGADQLEDVIRKAMAERFKVPSIKPRSVPPSGGGCQGRNKGPARDGTFTRVASKNKASGTPPRTSGFASSFGAFFPF